MSVLAKAVALLAAASPHEVERMPPAERQRLAHTLRHWLRLVEPPTMPPAPRSGVLAELSRHTHEWR